MNIIRKLSLAALFAAVGLSMAPATAKADATCSSPLSSKFSTLKQYGGIYTFELTVTKDSLSYVTYSTGTIGLNGSYLNGSADLAFSDRYNGNQNFNINGTENVRIWINSTGGVWLYNDNVHYWILLGTDMTCNGGVMSKYVPGLGMVVLAIRGYTAPIG